MLLSTVLETHRLLCSDRLCRALYRLSSALIDSRALFSTLTRCYRLAHAYRLLLHSEAPAKRSNIFVQHNVCHTERLVAKRTNRIGLIHIQLDKVNPHNAFCVLPLKIMMWRRHPNSLQRSNARRLRSSRHNFTKENTDKCRKFHFNRKT